MSLYSLVAGKGPSGFGYGSTAEAVSAGIDLTGKRFLVTGSNSGLGLETVRVLTLRGATVIATARTEEKAKRATDGLAHADRIIPLACELGDHHSVRAAAEAVRAMGEPLDGIITNAGIMALPEREQIHGIEKQFFVNHIGHFILVTGLLETLSPTGRIVSLSSSAHTGPVPGGIDLDNLSGERGYRSWPFYGQSKLANLLFARELSRRFEGTEQIACSVHPGVIATNLARHQNRFILGVVKVLSPLVLKTIPQGAATQVWAAVSADPQTIDGKYLYDCNVQNSSRLGRDMDLAKRLWDRSEEIVARLP
ncbi:MAG: SDR family NAD(P)-dependent oxidoreductase [Myxococcota bacterium]